MRETWVDPGSDWEDPQNDCLLRCFCLENPRTEEPDELQMWIKRIGLMSNLTALQRESELNVKKPRWRPQLCEWLVAREWIHITMFKCPEQGLGLIFLGSSWCKDIRAQNVPGRNPGTCRLCGLGNHPLSFISPSVWCGDRDYGCGI